MKADTCFTESLETSHPGDLKEFVQKAGKPKTRRPCRYTVAMRCRDGWACYQRHVLAQRVRGTKLSIGDAVKAVRASQEPGATVRVPGHESLAAALASVGVSVVAADAADPASSAMDIKLEPTMLRKAYRRMPRREPHTFACGMSLDGANAEEGDEGDELDGEDWEYLAYQRIGSRYPSGIYPEHEIRMQVEVLRQNLTDFAITVDGALDELCAGLQSPCAQAKRRCDGIVQALEQRGLRFHSVRKSWRLPRTGILLIERPQDLVRAYPSLGRFEPHRHDRLAIVDRPEHAGNEVRQGLLF